MEDYILIKKIQLGDTEAFDVLVRKYYRSIYQFCYRRLNWDSHTAADITQDVFLKLLKNINNVGLIGKFQNYLLTIAVNTCNNYFKKAKPEYTDDLEILGNSYDTDRSIENLIIKEEQIAVRQAIDTLPDYQKEVIILRYYYDLKIREIAKITATSIPTVKSRLQQGMKKLKPYLLDFQGGNIHEYEKL